MGRQHLVRAIVGMFCATVLYTSCQKAPDEPGSAVEPQPEVCGNGSDDDQDGLLDCEDADCVGSTGCGEICGDGIDNDNDGYAECLDDECWGLQDCGDGMVSQVRGGTLTHIDELERSTHADYSASGASFHWISSHRQVGLEALSVYGSVVLLDASPVRRCTWRLDRVSLFDRVPWRSAMIPTRSGFTTSGACGLTSTAFLPPISPTASYGPVWQVPLAEDNKWYVGSVIGSSTHISGDVAVGCCSSQRTSWQVELGPGAHWLHNPQ